MVVCDSLGDILWIKIQMLKKINYWTKMIKWIENWYVIFLDAVPWEGSPVFLQNILSKLSVDVLISKLTVKADSTFSFSFLVFRLQSLVKWAFVHFTNWSNLLQNVLHGHNLVTNYICGVVPNERCCCLDFVIFNIYYFP